MLSVVLAVHNEEKTLKRCLDSVRGLAEELIVVDGESTDNTVQIAQAAGARVITTTNKSNFHINKQMAIDAATLPLILQLDADEVLDDELKQALLKLKFTIAQTQKIESFEPKAWNIARKNWYLGRFLRKGGQYPDAVIRLFIKGFARLPQKNVHEQMVVAGTIGTIAGHLLHYSHPTVQDSVRKMNTYTSFEAERLHTARFTPSVSSVLSYFLFKPVHTFFSIFLRHRGYVDGLSGFVFALMSALHHPLTMLKLWEQYERDK